MYKTSTFERTLSKSSDSENFIFREFKKDLYFGGNFNSEEFWDIMRKWSSNNTVLVSEYKAPSDFKCIAEFKTANVLRNGANIRVPRTEKIFKYDSY